MAKIDIIPPEFIFIPTNDPHNIDSAIGGSIDLYSSIFIAIKNKMANIVVVDSTKLNVRKCYSTTQRREQGIEENSSRDTHHALNLTIDIEKSSGSRAHWDESIWEIISTPRDLKELLCHLQEKHDRKTWGRNQVINALIEKSEILMAIGKTAERINTRCAQTNKKYQHLESS